MLHSDGVLQHLTGFGQLEHLFYGLLREIFTLPAAEKHYHLLSIGHHIDHLERARPYWGLKFLLTQKRSPDMVQSNPTIPPRIADDLAEKIAKHGEEQAFRMGHVGFTCNFTDIGQIGALHESSRPSTEEDMLYAVDESSIRQTMTAHKKEIVKFWQNEKWLKNHRAEQAIVKDRLANQLMQAGAPQDSHQDAPDLRKLIQLLAESTAPPSAPNYVGIRILDQGALHPGSLPLSASFSQARIILTEFVKARRLVHCDETGEDPRALNKKQFRWRYQLYRPAEMKVLPRAIELRNENDWCRMMRVIGPASDHAGDKKQRPVAVLAWEEDK